jgi:hypothetical protein
MITGWEDTDMNGIKRLMGWLSMERTFPYVRGRKVTIGGIFTVTVMVLLNLFIISLILG